MGKRRQAWKVGDVLLVKLKDGSFVVGQIVGQERDVLNSVSCAFFDLRVKSEEELDRIDELPLDKIFAVLFVTRDLLDDGVWRVVGSRRVTLPKAQLPFERLRAGGFVGARVNGSGNVTDFLNAFYGLMPWDGWHDPNYLDGFLISPDKKPAKLMFKSSA
jgi:hypothetical protein